MTSGYRHSETLLFPVAVEFTIKGQSILEGTVGIRKSFPNYGNSYIHAETTFNKEAVGGTIYAGAQKNIISGQLGVTFHNADTLLGERNIPTFEYGRTNIEFWINLGINY